MLRPRYSVLKRTSGEGRTSRCEQSKGQEKSFHEIQTPEEQVGELVAALAGKRERLKEAALAQSGESRKKASKDRKELDDLLDRSAELATELELVVVQRTVLSGSRDSKLQSRPFRDSFSELERRDRMEVPSIHHELQRRIPMRTTSIVAAEERASRPIGLREEEKRQLVEDSRGFGDSFVEAVGRDTDG